VDASLQSSTPYPGERPSQLLRAGEVVRRLGVSRSWLYQAAKDGRIPAIRLGGPAGPLRFVSDDVDAWIDRARASWRPTDTAATTLRRAGSEDDTRRRTARPSQPPQAQQLRLG
jgi:excisionase family DNA binding protein